MNSAVVGNLRAILSLDTTNFDKGATSSEANAKKLADRLAKDLVPSQAKINQLVRDFAGNNDIRRAMEYATAVKEAGGAAQLTAKRQAEANRAVQSGIDVYRALGQKVPPELAKVARETSGANVQAKQFSTTLSTMKGVLGAFGVNLGISSIVSFGQSIFDTADKLVDLSSKMGVSVEAAQRFRYAARQSGADIEQVSQAIVKMSDKLSEGSKATVSALDAAGLKISDLRAMKPEDAFRSIADAIGKIPDPMKQAQVALELFGKGGAELLPMIREESLKAADGIKVMSEETVKRLEAAKQAWQNFGDAVVVETAEAGIAIANFVAGLSKPRGIDAFVTDFINSVLGGADPNLALLIATAKRSAAGSGAKEAPPPRSSFALTGDAAAFVSQQRAQQAIKDKEKQDKLDEEAAKKAEAELKRHEAAVAKLTGAKLRADLKEFTKDFRAALATGGISKAELDLTIKAIESFLMAGEKIDPTMLSWFADASMNRIISKNNDLNKSLFKTTMNFNQMVTAMERAKTPLPISETPWASLLGGSISSASLQLQTNIPKPLGMGDALKKQLKSSADAFPDMLVKAIVHGRDMGTAFHAIAVQFGSDIGDQIGKSLAFDSRGKSKGKFQELIGSAFGPLLGTGVSLLFNGIGKLFSSEGRRTNDIRDQFMEANGGLQGLHKQIAQFGNDPQLLSAFNRLYFTGKEGDFKKGMDAYQKRLAVLQSALAKGGELQAALQPFGGLLPSGATALVQQLLGGNLPTELRAQLEGAQKPTWQSALELAQSFGVDPNALGSGFNQSRIADTAFQIKRAADVFGGFQGSDRDAVLRGLADELSAVAGEAKKNNVALPKAIESLVRRVDEMNLLVDENGERIDASVLQFADIEDEYQKQVVGLLEQIRDLLSGKDSSTEPTVDPTASFFEQLRQRREASLGTYSGGVSIDDGKLSPDIGLPGFAGGTHGKFVDFGAGTPVMLHGKERVMTAAEGSGGGAMTVILERDGRSEARWLVPYIPGEVQRLRLDTR